VEGVVYTKYEPSTGADPGFQVRGAHLKTLRRVEEGAKYFGVFRVKNHYFTPKNYIVPPVLMGSMLLIFLFSVMCCIVLLCFVCLRPVSCVPIVASVS
jgi:hypothetical protein